MSNSDILALVYELKDKLLNSELYKDMKIKEERLFLDEECARLLSCFQQLKEEYKETKRFEKYGSNVENIQKRLSEVKCQLDENLLVKEYNEAYKKMKLTLKELENCLFQDIIEEKKEIEIE